MYLDICYSCNIWSGQFSLGEGRRILHNHTSTLAATHIGKRASLPSLSRQSIPVLTMAFTIIRTTVFLALILLASARPQTEWDADSWAVGMENDWVSSGNYRIYSCSSQAPDVKKLLDLTYLYLQNAILSTDGPAYKAYFHSANPARVQTVLRSITAGNNISTADHGSKQPTLVCLNEKDLGIAYFWNACKDKPRPIVSFPPKTSYVFLCPIFFEFPVSPDSDQCSAVNHANTRLLTDRLTGSIARRQTGLLILALADIYLRETGVNVLKGDVMDENAGLALPPNQAVKTASSYALFACSMSLALWLSSSS